MCEATLARYYFDIHDDQKGIQRDEIGVELADLGMVHRTAQRVLPDIVQDEIPQDGDRRLYTVLVKTEDGSPVYSASLAYTGMWLLR